MYWSHSCSVHTASFGHHKLTKELVTISMGLGWCFLEVDRNESCKGVLRAVPEIILRGGGPQAHFCPVGEGCFVDNVSEGWGVNLSWGSRRI